MSRPRSTRAFCVGQAKSGTASLWGLLSGSYRAAHEPERAEVLDVILREARGDMTIADVHAWLAEREGRLCAANMRRYFPAVGGLDDAMALWKADVIGDR